MKNDIYEAFKQVKQVHPDLSTKMECVYQLLHTLPFYSSYDKEKDTTLLKKIDSWLYTHIIQNTNVTVSKPFFYLYILYILSTKHGLHPSFHLITKSVPYELIQHIQWNTTERKLVRWLDKYKRKSYFHYWMDLYVPMIDKLEKGYIDIDTFKTQTELYLDNMYPCLQGARPIANDSIFPMDSTPEEKHLLYCVASLY